MYYKKRVKNYKYYLKTIGEYGVVKEINYPIVKITGLPSVKANELVLFESGNLAEVFTIEKDYIDVLFLSKEKIKNGEKVVRTDEFISVGVGKELLGSIIDSLGKIIYSSREIKLPKNEREVDVEPHSIDKRVRIKKPLSTGVSIVDLLMPLGKGQRELVLGDRKTGKTSFLLTTVKNQIGQGTVVIYAAIGKKKSEVKKLQDFFVSQKLMDKVLVVASYSDDPPSLIYLTPYTAMTQAEYFRDNGTDVLLILDDLSTHAKFYREMSLMARRFPGRESYPGDIFYIHARLLERAGNFKHLGKGEVSITCLPVVETVEGDLTGYISTNVMGMTDGHIFFDSNIFYKGRRPAINIALSVTRVGRQTQTHLKRQLNSETTAFLSNYEKMQSLSHFGAELSEKVKNILKMGDKIYAFFDEHYATAIPEAVQIVMFALIWLHNFDDVSNEKLVEVKNKMIKAYEKEESKKLLHDLISVQTFHELLINVGKNKEKIIQLIGKP